MRAVTFEQSDRPGEQFDKPALVLLSIGDPDRVLFVAECCRNEPGTDGWASGALLHLVLKPSERREDCVIEPVRAQKVSAGFDDLRVEEGQVDSHCLIGRREWSTLGVVPKESVVRRSRSTQQEQ
ncbi:hypothetical protein OG981_02240 [Streptomyces mirabilis]|nr:hypothetical protein [Streptomyces mirabilis]MCX4418271.1 hypothetical protein [Streptomyces mirabilis]